MARAEIGALRIVGEHGFEIGCVIATHQADDRDLLRQRLELRRRSCRSAPRSAHRYGGRPAWSACRSPAADRRRRCTEASGNQRLQPRLHHFGHHLERGVGEIVDEQRRPAATVRSSVRARSGSADSRARARYASGAAACARSPVRRSLKARDAVLTETRAACATSLSVTLIQTADRLETIAKRYGQNKPRIKPKKWIGLAQCSSHFWKRFQNAAGIRRRAVA